MAVEREHRHSGSWAAWIAGLLVIAIALKVTIGLHGTFDVYFDDETIYLDGAHHLGERFLPLAESSPLYPMWYRALGVLQPDPLKLYFLNWFVLTASLPILLYVLARRSGAPVGAALAVAVVWALSSASMTWPFVSRFATLVLAVGALASTYTREPRIAVAITSVALSAAAYARPELLLPSTAFVAIVVLWCLGSVVRKRPERRHGPGLVAALIAIVPPPALHFVFGKFSNPFAHGRLFFAFGQHYALNVVEARGLAVDPWTSWLPIAREAFPKASSITEAVRENPSAFFWHLKRNLTVSPTALRELLQPLPHEPRPIVIIAGGALALTLAWVAASMLSRRSVRPPPSLGRWLPMFAVVALAAGGSAMLVHPRQHYILPLGFIGLAALAASAGDPPWRTPALRDRALVRRLRDLLLVAGALLLAAVPTARRGALPSLLHAVGEPPVPEAQQENRATIHALRKLGLVSLPWGPVTPRAEWMPTVVILEPDYSRGVYAFYNFVRIEQWRKEMPFWKFLRGTWTNVVVLNWRLKTDAHLKDDPEFIAFADGTGEREDFEMFPVEGTSIVLAVRRSLLEFASAKPGR